MRIPCFPAKFVRIYKLFLDLVIVGCYNVIQRCRALLHIGSKHRNDKALPNAELLFVIPEGIHMAVSYKKLWKLLIDKEIKKKDLSAMAGVSPATITKMGKNGHVTTEVLLKICTALNCQVEDVMEIIPEAR
jgi:DNA-binding Xre family transcriptional regulator